MSETKEPTTTITIPSPRLGNLHRGIRLLVNEAERLYEASNRNFGSVDESPLTKEAWDNFCDLQSFEVDLINGAFDGVQQE